MTAVLETRPDSGRISRPLLPNFRTPYRPDIEGLRAIAVLGVVAFHASVPHLAGGFVGVDVFFVISGFLITSLLLTEGADSGRVSLKEFYARRARRILPSAALTLVVTAVASLAILPPLRVRDTAMDLLESAVYASNWRFIGLDTNYLTENRDPSPVLHFWSLAVEEQFYLLWPLLVLVGLLIARRLGRRALPGIVTMFAVTSAVSLWLSLHWTTTSAPLAYLSSPSRAWQFGVGALLAAAVPALRKVSGRRLLRALGYVAGWAGLVAVVVACIVFDSSTPYPGTASFLPTFGTLAMVFSGIVCGTDTGSVGELLQVRPMRAIGRLSFAWYLWHWPALVLVQAKFGPQPWPVQVAIALGAVVPAMLTLRMVERPIRFNRTIATRASSGIAVGVIATVLSVIAALGVGERAMSVLTDGATQVSDEIQVSNATLAQVFGTQAAARNSGPVTPSALAAPTDYPSGTCIAEQTATAVQPCHFGSTTGPQMVLFGDSHAHQWQPAFQKVVAERGWGFYLFAHAGCPAAALEVSTNPGYAQCNVWRTSALADIRSLHPALIIVSSYSGYLGNGVDRSATWGKILAELTPMTKQVAYLADTPTPGIDAPTCISGHLSDWSACFSYRKDAIRADPLQELQARGQFRGVPELDLDSYLCPGTGPTCPIVRGGVLLYRDTTHITATAAAILAPAMVQALDVDHLMAKH